MYSTPSSMVTLFMEEQLLNTAVDAEVSVLGKVMLSSFEHPLNA